jgi:hypothetical protein
MRSLFVPLPGLHRLRLPSVGVVRRLRLLLRRGLTSPARASSATAPRLLNRQIAARELRPVKSNLGAYAVRLPIAGVAVNSRRKRQLSCMNLCLYELIYPENVMGRKSKSGGVTVAGRERIQFDFNFGGVRYRPTLPRTPSETNLRHAREHLVGIKERIDAGTFSFAEEFPDFRHLNKVPDEGCPRTLTCSTPFSRIANRA